MKHWDVRQEIEIRPVDPALAAKFRLELPACTDLPDAEVPPARRAAAWLGALGVSLGIWAGLFAAVGKLL